MHLPLQGGAVQHCLFAWPTSAEADSGRHQRLAADCESFLQACPAAAAAVAAVVAAESVAVAVAGRGADEEAHLQPCEVLVSWIWPRALPLLLQVVCHAALPQKLHCDLHWSPTRLLTATTPDTHA